MRRKKGTIYAPLYEQFELKEVFDQLRNKSFTRETFADRGSPTPFGAKYQEMQKDVEWEAGFVFRGDFENCGKLIKGDILKYQQRMEKKRKSAAESTTFFWGFR